MHPNFVAGPFLSNLCSLGHRIVLMRPITSGISLFLSEDRREVIRLESERDHKRTNETGPWKERAFHTHFSTSLFEKNVQYCSVSAQLMRPFWAFLPIVRRRFLTFFPEDQKPQRVIRCAVSRFATPLERTPYYKEFLVSVSRYPRDLRLVAFSGSTDRVSALFAKRWSHLILS